jgi:uncharacterized protein with HEPN domain
MRRDDLARLNDALDAAREAVSFAEGADREDLDKDRKLQHSLVRLLEVIGEAMGAVSPEFRARHPTLPWRGAIGMRNRLIHHYFGIDLDLVIDTVHDVLPGFIEAAEKAIAVESG